MEAKGGKGTLFAQDYAARVAEEMGADIVKLHEPAEDNGAARSPTARCVRSGPESGCVAWCVRRGG